MLQLRDTRYNDIRLIFKEANHSYTDTLGNSYKSVTTLLHEYQPSFNKSYWLKRKLKNLVSLKVNLPNNGMLLKMRLVIEEQKLIII